MRWDELFEDIEARWADLGWQETVTDAAELTRAEWARIGVADRLRGARGADVRVHFAWGETLDLRVKTVGAGWFGAHVAGGGSVLVPLESVAALEGALGAAAPAPPGAAAELGLAAMLRGVARRRAAVLLTGRSGQVLAEGTVDRVGQDHLDVARHPRDESRRREAVRGMLVVPFGAIGVVRSATRLD